MCLARCPSQRAAAATHAGAFRAEIVPLEVKGESHVVDEGIRFDATAESIGSVKLLRDGGVLSAANASQICDGSAGVPVAGGEGVEHLLNLSGFIGLRRVSLELLSQLLRKFTTTNVTVKGH